MDRLACDLEQRSAMDHEVRADSSAASVVHNYIINARVAKLKIRDEERRIGLARERFALPPPLIAKVWTNCRHRNAHIRSGYDRLGSGLPINGRRSSAAIRGAGCWTCCNPVDRIIPIAAWSDTLQSQ